MDFAIIYSRFSGYENIPFGLGVDYGRRIFYIGDEITLFWVFTLMGLSFMGAMIAFMFLASKKSSK